MTKKYKVLLIEKVKADFILQVLFDAENEIVRKITKKEN